MKKIQKKKGQGNRLILVVPVLLAVVFIAAAAYLIYTLVPNKDRVSREEYFAVGADETAVIYNDSLLAVKPFAIDGHWYLSFPDLYYNICRYYYYDGFYLLYTDPTQTYRAKPGEFSYTGENGRVYKLDYAPCLFQDGSLAVSLEYTQLMNFTYFTVFEDENYIWITDDFGARATAEVAKDEALRTAGTIKAKVVCDEAAGSSVRVFYQENDWSYVQTEEGKTGYLRTKYLDGMKSGKPSTPDGRPLPVYTSISMDEPVVMGWHQMFTGSGYDELAGILEKADGMNVICPTWFTIKDDYGNIQNVGEKKYVTDAHKAGVQVWVMLQNIDIPVDELMIFGTTENRKNLISQTVSAVKELGADGINVDIENIKSDDGPNFLQFLRELSAACRVENLVLSVDNYSPMPHTAFYDRAQQAIIVDYVIVMAYDQHYAGDDDAGSTATTGWVHQSASRTIESVPKEKVIVGLPLYTRMWCETEAKPGDEKAIDNSSGALDSKYPVYTLTSKGLNMDGEQAEIEEHDLKLTWLEEEGQYYTEYQEGDSWYRMWVEDDRSTGLKLAAAFSYEPAGIAFFKVGHETPLVWAEVRKVLNQK